VPGSASAPVARAPLQSKKTLVGLPAASFFGQQSGAPAAVDPRFAGGGPPHGREREATQEVSLADTSLASLGLSAEPADAGEVTQNVFMHELSLASHQSSGAAEAEPLLLGVERGDVCSTHPAPPRPARNWLWAVAAVPLLLGAGWWLLGAPPRPVTASAVRVEPSAAVASQARVPEAAAPAALPEPTSLVPAAEPTPPEADVAGKRADSLSAQASALRKRKKLGPARSKYRAALALEPGHVGALRGLTQIAIQQRDGDQAVERARALVEASPEDPSALVLLGDAYKLAGKRKDSRQAWQAAAKRGSVLARKRLK